MTQQQKQLQEVLAKILIIELAMDTGSKISKKTHLQYFALKKKREELWVKINGLYNSNIYL